MFIHSLKIILSLLGLFFIIGTTPAYSQVSCSQADDVFSLHYPDFYEKYDTLAFDNFQFDSLRYDTLGYDSLQLDSARLADSLYFADSVRNFYADSVFIFHSPKSGFPISSSFNNPIPGRLLAYHSDTIKSNFIWKKWNPYNKSYDTLKAEDSVSFSVYNLNNEYATGAFEVEIHGEGDTLETYHCWVFVDHLEVVIDEVNDEDCQQINFEVTTDFDDFIFTDLFFP